MKTDGLALQVAAQLGRCDSMVKQSYLHRLEHRLNRRRHRPAPSQKSEWDYFQVLQAWEHRNHSYLRCPKWAPLGGRMVRRSVQKIAEVRWILIDLHGYSKRILDLIHCAAGIQNDPVGIHAGHGQPVRLDKINDGLILVRRGTKHFSELVGRQKLLVICAGGVVELVQQDLQLSLIVQRKSKTQVNLRKIRII